MQSIPVKRKCAVLVCCIFSVALLFPVSVMAQETTIQKEKVSISPKTDMLKSILQNSKWGVVDRPIEAIYEVEQNLQAVRTKIKALRATLISTSSKAEEEKLQDYVTISRVLSDMKVKLELIQISMTECKTKCSKMEVAAAEGKPQPEGAIFGDEPAVPAQRYLSQLNKSRNELESLAKKVEDTQLEGLAKELGNDLEALKKAVDICGTCLIDVERVEGKQLVPEKDSKD